MNNEDFEVYELNEETGEQKTPKKKKLSITSIFLIFVGIICIVISVFQLTNMFSDYKEAADKYDNLENEFVQMHMPESESDSENISDPGTETTEMADVPQVPWYEMVSVDLAGLQKKYPDVVGWIYFENEDISYPIMQGDELETYLYRTYDGKDSKSGSIFISPDSDSSFSAAHTFIYGHNMKNLSMFGKLKYYKTKSGYYDEHKYVQIFSGNEILRYRIFAYQDVPVTHAIYSEAPHTSAKTVASLLSSTSMVDAGIDITNSDKTVTFSTCTADEEHRFIVSAVLVERYTISE